MPDGGRKSANKPANAAIVPDEAAPPTPSGLAAEAAARAAQLAQRAPGQPESATQQPKTQEPKTQEPQIEASLAADAAAGAVAAAVNRIAADAPGTDVGPQQAGPAAKPSTPSVMAAVVLPALPSVRRRLPKPLPSVMAAPALQQRRQQARPVAVRAQGEPSARTSPGTSARTGPRTSPRTSPRSWLGWVLRMAIYGIGGYAALCLLAIAAYRFVDPPASTLMIWQRLTGVEINQQWVPLDEVSPNLIRAVIASEDARFCQHNGVDLEALRTAVERAKGGIPRGASTISMQVAKNLFLWPSKSYVRKAIEIPLTLLMELVWPKRRMLEIYLNIAEWGDGIFGAQAASAYHFDKSAADLSLRQAALLAVALPNPFVREAGDPGRGTNRLARRIIARVKGGGGPAGCVLDAR